jgi:hypothetical protein
MNRRTIAALGAAFSALALQPAFGEPAVDIQTRCFRFSDQPGKLLQLRLIDTDEDNEAAFVRYVGSRAWIPLVLSISKDIPMADSGRSQLDEEWVEVVHDQVVGRYMLSMLGAEVISFGYVNRKTGKKTEFALAPRMHEIDPCESKK